MPSKSMDEESLFFIFHSILFTLSVKTLAQGMSIKYTDMKTCFQITYLETYLSKSILYYGCLCLNALLMVRKQHVACSPHVAQLKVLENIIFTYVDSIHYFIRQGRNHPLSCYDHCVATARCQWIKISFNAKKKPILLILNRLHNWLLSLKSSCNLHAWISDHVAHKWQQLDAPVLGTKHYL